MTARVVTIPDAVFLVSCSAFAVMEVAFLLHGVRLPVLHALALVVHLMVLRLILRAIRRRLRERAYLAAMAPLLLSVRAWGVVYEDRDHRGAPDAWRARLGLFRALDVANSQRAALEAGSC